MPEPTLNEISVTVGSLRAQIVNLEAAVSRMVESQAKIVDSLTENRESAAGFKEYRGTLHERFNHIHAQIGDIDQKLEKQELRFERNEREIVNRFDTMQLKLDNLGQAIELKYEHRVDAVERQQTEWKASIKTTYSIAFFVATIFGSIIGYLGEVAVRSLGGH